jgi:hypothetical protein
MTNFQNIKLLQTQIEEIEQADLKYRSTDLEKLAILIESDILNDRLGLFSILPVSPDICKFNNIIRVTINKTVTEDGSNRRLTKIENLRYPPEKIKYKLGYNRANFKNQSIFYGGFGDFQGLFENPPSTGDLFTISTWHQNNNSKLCYVSIFHDRSIQEQTNEFINDWNHYMEQLSFLDSNTRIAIEKLFSLITFFFTRPVDENKKIEYLFSAHIANKIFDLTYIPKIEAILFPSVPMRFISSNIAILPSAFDNKFTFVKADEYIVLQNEKGKNQWINSKLGEATSLDNDNLNWGN